jgi:predicted phosphodiesterase
MTGEEKIIIYDNMIKLSTDNDRSAVMHNGEKFLMQELAKLATKNGGDILEIGFGMHLSADAIQSNTNVISHTIIEIHPVQYEKALEWAKLQKIKTTIILGDWIELLPLSNMKFDGVLHDTYLDKNIHKFLDYIVDNCKKDTIVSFFEFSKFDLRLNGYRVTIPKDEWETIPYKNNIHFESNQFELKYTTFNGDDFYSKKIINKLL